MQGRKKQSVVAARQMACNGSRSTPAEAIRHQPLALPGSFYLAADFAAKGNHSGNLFRLEGRVGSCGRVHKFINGVAKGLPVYAIDERSVSPRITSSRTPERPRPGSSVHLRSKETESRGQ